jgi:hypothetical protein
LAWGEPIDVLHFLEGRETESFTFFIIIGIESEFGCLSDGGVAESLL